MRSSGLALGALLVASLGAVASAQIVQPTNISDSGEMTGELTASSESRSDFARYNCYVIDTSAGENVTVSQRASTFESRIGIARGSLCGSANVQYWSEPDGNAARATFTSPGGRYVILAGAASADASGAYELTVERSAQLAAAGGDASTTSADRRAIMEQEVAQHRAKIAAEEARQRAETARILAEQQAYAAAQAQAQAEWEEQRRYEQAQNSQHAMNLLNAFTSGFNQEMAAQQQMQAQVDYYADMAAEAARQEQWLQQQADNERAAAAAEQAMMAAENQRRIAEQARLAAAAAEQQRLAAMRTPQPLPVNPVGGQASPSDAGGVSQRASTESDPNLCVTRPVTSPYKNCGKGVTASVTNNCPNVVEARICHMTTEGRWDCGMNIGVQPNQTWSSSSCFGTGEVYSFARSKSARGPWPEPN